MIKFLVIFTSFLFSNGWDIQCPMPDGKMRIPHPEITPTEDNSTVACSHQSGTYYYCYSTSEKQETWIVREPITDGSSTCNVTIKVSVFQYVDAIDCGNDAILNGDGLCICKTPSMLYDSTSKSCACPAGQVYNNDTCEDGCADVPVGYIESSFKTEAECTRDNLQNLYNQNNNDNRIIDVLPWHCDDKCYFKISPFSTNLSSAYYAETVSQSDCNSIFLNNYLTQDWEALHNYESGETVIDTVNAYIDEVEWSRNNKCYFSVKYFDNNNTADTDSNTTENNDSATNTDNTNPNTDNNNNTNNETNTTGETRLSVIGTQIFQAIKQHDNHTNTNLNNLASILNTNHDNLMTGIGDMETKLYYMHNQLTTISDLLKSSNSTSSDIKDSMDSLNSTNTKGFNDLANAINNLGTGNDTNGSSEFNDNRIVQANNNTTKAVKSIGKYLGSDTNISDLNISFDEFSSIEKTANSAIDKMNSTISEMNKSKDELTEMIENEVTQSVDDFEDKSKFMLSELLDRIFSDSFNPFNPLIEVGKVPSNFQSLHIPINIDVKNFKFHQDISMTKAQLLGDLSNPDVAKIYKIIKMLSLFIAVLFGFLYLVRGVSNV